MNKLHLSFKRGILDEAFLEKYHAGLALEDIVVESFKFMQQFGIKALDIVKEMQISKCNASTLKAMAIHAHSDIRVEDFAFMQQHGVKALDVLSDIQISRTNVSTLKQLSFMHMLLVLDFSLLHHIFHMR